MMSTAGAVGDVDGRSAYALAFTDWLACASAGADERAARAVRSTGADVAVEVAFAATAGHALDFDDTFAEGVAHVSAACAPAALVLAAHLGLSLGAMLDAYAEGYEAMAAVAAASHPRLYAAGWHPTSVCGPIGAAIAAARLLGQSSRARENALAIALLRTGGTRAAFGSDGKAIQVGQAAAAGVQAALLARAGAVVDPRAIYGPLGFKGVLGAGWPEAGFGSATAAQMPRAIDRTWIKLYPSCLGTHSPIEAAERVRALGYRPGDGQLTVLVHPTARQAAHLDIVDDGTSAKFSIPYCVAYTLTKRPPGVHDFAAIDAAARELSRQVRVQVDGSLPEFGAVLTVAERELARVSSPRGAPDRPASASELARKVASLAAERLGGALDDLNAPAERALSAAGLRTTEAGAGSGRSGAPSPDLQSEAPPVSRR